MKFSDNAMSAILLCSYIGIKSEDSVKPFSMGEWNAFLEKIATFKYEPSMILKENIEVLKEMKYSDEYINRIQKLVSRGGAVAFELDNLAKKGIEVVTLFDSDYPILLKRKLKKKTPPVLYYAGNLQLAKKIGIAVVGSRNVDEDGIEFTKRLVEKASKEKLIIYSGGAKGVDTISEKIAIEAGGAVVSFVADSLLTKIKKKDILDDIIQGKLLLISDVKPDAGFSTSRAMNRNKYIYTSAYGAFVVASDYNKGGTWSGATEAIRNEWTKVFIWKHQEYNGNLKLIEKGGKPYELSSENIYDIITKEEKKYEQLDFLDIEKIALICEGESEYIASKDNVVEDMYDFVKSYIIEHLGTGMDTNEAAQKFNVAKGQMAAWLKRLYKDGFIECINGVYSKI